MSATASATDAVALRDFVDELALAGLRDVVVCPGSRSTPIALAVRSNPGLRIRVLLDERSAGFFALGLARASRRPVALVVTSGTAAANLFPAVVEASLGRVPLVLLTADRPAELRDRGAPQTIDQLRLFGGYAKWFAELPLVDGTDETRRHLRSVAGRAVATALEGPAGPVHLNMPFREPLIPSGGLATGSGDRDGEVAGRTPPFTELVTGPRTLEAAALARIARTLRDRPRGLIVAGPQDDPTLPAALARLARGCGYPIVADPLSLVRTGPHDRGRVIARGDLILRPGPWRDAHLPDVVVRFGATPTSKPLDTWLASLDPPPVQFVVDGDGGWREPGLMRSTFVHADARSTADALADTLADALAGGQPRALGPDPDPGPAAGDPTWTSDWLAAERAADRAARSWLDEVTATGEPFEGAPFPPLAEILPDRSILWASSSMPVRDMDAWLPSTARAIRPMSNRGANGIDGVVSSALGAAAALADAGTDGRVALVVGDLAFLHDLNALVAAKLHGLSATIVLVDNDGGGIFSFLPQATADVPTAGLPEHYEELFGTPHGIEVGPIVRALGGRHRTVEARDLRDALGAAIDTAGVDVLELRTERRRNVELHREAAAAVGRTLEALVGEVRPR